MPKPYTDPTKEESMTNFPHSTDVQILNKILANRVQEVNKCYFIKQRYFCTAKKTFIWTKCQLTKWEKIFTNYTPNRGLMSKICKELKNKLLRKQITHLK